jgi:hypothetical protein
MDKSKWITAASILLLTAAFIFIVFSQGINLFGSDGSSQSEDIPDKTVLPGDDEKIYNSLRNEQYDTISVYPDISFDTVKELISDVEMPESYYWYFKSTIYSSKKSRSYEGIMKFDKGNYRIELYSDSGDLEKTVIEDSGIISVQTYSGNANIAEFSASSTTVFAEAGVPSASAFIESDGEIYSYSLIESEYGTLLYAEFESKKDNFSQTEQYYISLDYGIVVRADCYENGVLVYSLKTASLYEIENS